MVRLCLRRRVLKRRGHNPSQRMRKTYFPCLASKFGHAPSFCCTGSTLCTPRESEDNPQGHCSSGCGYASNSPRNSLPTCRCPGTSPSSCQLRIQRDKIPCLDCPPRESEDNP